MNILEKTIKHFCTIMKHKWVVFKLSIKAGIPYQGIKHDLSKFSPTEFWESVKYYQGNRSPIMACKEENGYSKAWLHHKGRNKHHYEYWYDSATKEQTPIMPYKYVVEMICDTMAAGIVYNGKKWTNSTQLDYWNKNKQTAKIHPKVAELLTEFYMQVAKNGIDKTLNKKNLKQLYSFFCENVELK